MLLYGKELAQNIIKQIKKKVKKSKIKPCLGIILVGENNASQLYVKKKMESAKKAGISAKLFHLSKDIKEKELLGLIKKLNKNRRISGFIVQLPVPKHINSNKIIETINPEKDVDGFHALNAGRLVLNLSKEAFLPPTAFGIIRLIEHYRIPIAGKNAVVIGRSNIVGKPIALMLLHKNATVSICHSKTKNLEYYTKNADILIVAAGKPGLVKSRMVKKGACVIDVGITRIKEKIVGDVEPDVKNKAHLSPVPGGVGPLTVAMVLENTFKAAERRKKNKTG